MATLKIDRKKPFLNFTYCECGCHGSEATFMGRDFWIFIEIHDGKAGPAHLYGGHGCTSPKLSSHNSFAEASEEAERLVRKELTKAVS